MAYSPSTQVCTKTAAIDCNAPLKAVHRVATFQRDQNLGTLDRSGPVSALGGFDAQLSLKKIHPPVAHLEPPGGQRPEIQMAAPIFADAGATVVDIEAQLTVARQTQETDHFAIVFLLIQVLMPPPHVPPRPICPASFLLTERDAGAGHRLAPDLLILPRNVPVRIIAASTGSPGPASKSSNGVDPMHQGQ